MAIRSTEADIQKEGMRILRTCYGISCWRRNVGAMKTEGRFIRFSESGMADAWGILPDGRHLEIEFKRPGNRPTAKQLAWLIAINRLCPAIWTDNNVTLRRVIEAILAGGRVVYRDNGDYDIEVNP